MLKKLNLYFYELSKTYSINTVKFGIFRSLLALSTLLTLVFNETSVLFLSDNSGKYFNPAFNDDKFLNFFLVFGEDNLVLSKVLAILFLLLVMSGYAIKVSSLFHWWIAISYFKLSSIIDGGDQINSILTLLIIPLALLDNRSNHWFKGKNEPKKWFSLLSIFALFLIRIQIAVIYFNAAVSKFKVEEWSDGTALYYWFNNSFFGVSNNTEELWLYLLSYDWIVISLTYGSILLELLLFLCLFAKQNIRKKLLIPAFAFHLGIMWFMGIFTFSLTMLSCCYYYLISHHYENK